MFPPGILVIDYLCSVAPVSLTISWHCSWKYKPNIQPHSIAYWKWQSLPRNRAAPPIWWPPPAHTRSLSTARDTGLQENTTQGIFLSSTHRQPSTVVGEASLSPLFLEKNDLLRRPMHTMKKWHLPHHAPRRWLVERGHLTAYDILYSFQGRKMWMELNQLSWLTHEIIYYITSMSGLLMLN